MDYFTNDLCNICIKIPVFYRSKSQLDESDQKIKFMNSEYNDKKKIINSLITSPKDKNAEFALAVACRYSTVAPNKTVIKILLELGVDPNSKAGRCEAMFNVCPKLKNNFSLKNELNKDYTPLMTCIESKYSDVNVIDILIAHGADINMCDANGRNLLAFCLDSSTFPNAIDNNKIRCLIKHLIKLGININSVDSNNRIPLMIYLWNCNFRDPVILDCIINSELPVNIQDVDGDTLLIKWVYHQKTNANTNIIDVDQIRIFEKYLRKFLQMGLNINLRNKNGDTALDIAITYDMIPFVKLLLESGANPCGANTDDRTSLHKAIFHHREQCAILLMNYGAFRDLLSQEKIAVAAYNIEKFGNLTILEEMIEIGIEIDECVGDKCLLSIAIDRKDVSICEYLLKKGSNPDIFINGLPAVQNTTNLEQYDISILLVEYGADINFVNPTNKTILSKLIAGGNCKHYCNFTECSRCGYLIRTFVGVVIMNINKSVDNLMCGSVIIECIKYCNAYTLKKLIGTIDKKLFNYFTGGNEITLLLNSVC